MGNPVVLHPEAIYTAEEVAAFLKIQRKEVYGIPEGLLPKRRVGPRGGAVRYYGRDVLQYVLGRDEGLRLVA